MNPMQTVEQQLGLALQQNDAQQQMIAHISERRAAMEEAGKICDEKVHLLTNQLHLAASVLADVPPWQKPIRPEPTPSYTRQLTLPHLQAYPTPYYHESTKWRHIYI
jgi:hypothetical protein